ncbi:MAG: hypothetical protein E7165_02085 [Firmicutes bacterium]|nr:hypothetical protein [Bacillota bacterium]
MPDESYYRERGEERNWPKLILFILGGIILFLIVFLLVKGCMQGNKNTDIEKALLEAGKSYYNADITLLPSAIGECKEVTLGNLINKNLISEPDNYSDCNKSETRVKVCKLESGNYHYLPILQCGTTLANDNFGPWKDGSELDLTTDKSDVRFTFKGEYKEVSVDDEAKEEEAWLDELTGINYQTISSTKYYRYRDLMWKWQTTSKEYYSKDTNVYYASTPENSYTEKEGTTTGWKWYTETKQSSWEKTSNPTVTEASLFRYICYNGEIKQSDTVCGEGWVSVKQGTGYICTKGSIGPYTKPCSELGSQWKEYGRQYSCDGSNVVAKGTVCSITCPTGSILNNDKTECGNMVETTKKQYYPSNSVNASDENKYYLEAPITGAIKDLSTEASVSRYFKTVTTTTSKYYTSAPSIGAVKVGDGIWGNWTAYQKSEPKAYKDTREIETRTKVVYKKINNSSLNNWLPISDDYLSEVELISEFKKLGYRINTLDDIENLEELRYQVKLQYRDRK